MMHHVYRFILRAVTLSNPSLASKLYLPSFTSLFSFSLSLLYLHFHTHAVGRIIQLKNPRIFEITELDLSYILGDFVLFLFFSSLNWFQKVEFCFWGE